MAAFLSNPWTIRVLTLIVAAGTFLLSGAPIDASSVATFISGALAGLLSPQVGAKKGGKS